MVELLRSDFKGQQTCSVWVGQLTSVLWDELQRQTEGNNKYRYDPVNEIDDSINQSRRELK